MLIRLMKHIKAIITAVSWSCPETADDINTAWIEMNSVHSINVYSVKSKAKVSVYFDPCKISGLLHRSCICFGGEFKVSNDLNGNPPTV